MSLSVPQHILDALTDVAMPRLKREPDASELRDVAGFAIPVFCFESLVIGSGAAGLRGAVEMKRRDVDVAIISQSAWGGTSACSGSDKQTLHTANTKDQGDDFHEMAAALRAGGAMDEDTAYIEAVGSIRAMASLQYLGLPLPQDKLGGTLRYQTDHDEVGRATSCGPRTSRLMVKVLAEEALRLDIPFFNQTTAVKVLTTGSGDQKHVTGVLTIRPKASTEQNPYGLTLYECESLVFAAGGPGEMYRDSVFPNGCFGSLGLALEAGLELVNLTESQFGIGTPRKGFPWNLSGTYVQVIPHIYSVDADGQEHHFLAEYYRSTQEMASNIFRKGYQWPFHASRMLDFKSSLVDLAIYRESQKGRQVFLDFNRNLLPVPGDHEFHLERLDPDVRDYLSRSGADQDRPIERLRHLNPLAIELYKRYKVDITVDPLECTVNNQHMNGGIAVDSWGRTNISGIYAVGEAAGTHGATRPGGSALNAGQVFGTRVAEHIAACDRAGAPLNSDQSLQIQSVVSDLVAVLNADSPISMSDVRRSVQDRMSDHAGILCYPEDVKRARHEARELSLQIRKKGISFGRNGEAGRILQWQQMALASEAVLAALEYFIDHNGGSRGARAICDPNGASVPQARSGALSEFRFRPERVEDMQSQILVRLVDRALVISTRANRGFDTSAKSVFERDWPAWLTGGVFDLPNDP